MACKLQVILSSYPERALLASTQGSAKVQLESRALKALDAAGAECADALSEDLLGRQILPAVRRRVEAAKGGGRGD